MGGALNKKYRTSRITDRCLIKLKEYCNFSPEILKVPVIPKPLCKVADCHNNVNCYVNTYGGERIDGYYLITDLFDDNCGCAIYHSVWKNTFGNIVDITPFDDKREYNIFSISKSKDYYSGIIYDGSGYFPYE